MSLVLIVTIIETRKKVMAENRIPFSPVLHILNHEVGTPLRLG
jgi:hypothetical protein